MIHPYRIDPYKIFLYKIDPHKIEHYKTYPYRIGDEIPQRINPERIYPPVKTIPIKATLSIRALEKVIQGNITDETDRFGDNINNNHSNGGDDNLESPPKGVVTTSTLVRKISRSRTASSTSEFFSDSVLSDSVLVGFALWIKQDLGVS